jgi:hypothetical protein
MGRRLKNKPIINRVQLNVRVSETLKTDLEDIAIADDKDLIDIVVEVLSTYVKKRKN